MEWIYVFNGRGFAGGVFTARGSAEEWIAKHRLTGMLTRYPVDIGIFEPKKEKDFSPEFIGSFTSASMDHWHYEDGVLRAGMKESDWELKKQRLASMKKPD